MRPRPLGESSAEESTVEPAPLAHTVGDLVDEQAAGDEMVSESRDGTLVVRGHVTPERATTIAKGLSSPLLLLGFGLLALAGLVSLLRGQWGLAAVDGVLALLLGWVVVTSPRRVARRLLQFVGTDPLTWTYTPQGVGIAGARGSTQLPWSRVRDARIRGDMLVLRTRGMGTGTGALVRPLTLAQLERVLGWARGTAGVTGQARPPAG